MIEYLKLQNLSCSYRAVGRKPGWVRFDFGNGQIHVDRDGDPWTVIPDVDIDDFQKEVARFLDDNQSWFFSEKPKKVKVRKSKKRK